MERVTVGNQELAALAVRTLTEAEWERGHGHAETWAASVEDLLYFRLDGTVHVASFEMKTKLTAAVKAAVEAGDLRIGYRGREGTFLRSEDVENFIGRAAGHKEHT